MFRLAAKTPKSILLAKRDCVTSRLSRTVRHYSKRHDQQEKSGGSSLLYTFGAFTLVGGGALVYAKYDPEFRKLLAEYAPFTDSVIKFVFQEEVSIWSSLTRTVDNWKDSVTDLVGGESKKSQRNVKEVPVDYKPPPKVLGSLEKGDKEDASYAEIRLESKKDGETEPTVEIAGEVKPKERELPDTHPKNLAEIERNVGDYASKAVQSYNKAVFALRNYNRDIQEIIEQTVDRIDPELWQSLRTKTLVKNKALEEAEIAAAEALQYINKLKLLISKKEFEGTESVKEQVRHNIQKVQNDINSAKKELEDERKVSNITEKYWAKVEEARKHFAEELETLFPSVKIDEKQLKIDAEDLDLFVLQAYSNVLFYQKELSKLETITDQRLKDALDAARKGNAEVLTKAQLDLQLEKDRRRMQECFQLQCLGLKAAAEKDLRRQLKLQSEAFKDHLDDEVKTREMEIERELLRKFDEKLEAERCKYKLQLAAIMGRLRGLDQAFKARLDADKVARQSQALWSACQALFRSVRAGCPGVAWKQQLRPLTPEIDAIKKAAVDGDELVQAVLAGIPKEASERGIFPEDALRERFIKVEKLAKSLALVPEAGARLPLYILSWFQSKLLFDATCPIPQAELNDEQVDFGKLSTNEILQRARYWLDRGDFTQALRYMNLLKGAPRSIARQWMHETRILLETQQAAHTLMAHASASGLSYL